ncbi:phage portal protein [Paraburkholderia sp. BR10936]|uniref:phage portal protein n=1 Tax=Paraburkholderia sp. BR10936 TaxID=3236993 RepID=UPI0034D1D389
MKKQKTPFFKRIFTQGDNSPAPRSKFRKFVRRMHGMFKASFVDPADKWSAIPIPIEQFISLRLPALVARSREQWSNNPYVRGYVRRCRQNIVGEHGVLMQSKPLLSSGKLDKAASDAIEAAWLDWCKPENCDVAGKLSWRRMQALAIEHAARDGEFIFRKVRGDNAGPFGFALQLIDPVRLPVGYGDMGYGTEGNFIRNGIEFTRFGRVVAYHFDSLDESDAGFYYSVAGNGYVRVEAADIIHGFVCEMASQRRGIPWTSTGLDRMHNLGGFEDAAVQNARAGANQMGFIEYDDGFGPDIDDDDDVDVAATINAEPLSFHELPRGAHLKEFKPLYPNGEFATFNKSQLRAASTGWGVAYNGLANDLEGVNFSSIRDGKVDERDNWKELQQWLIEALCCPVFDDWIKYALLAGLIVNTKNGKPLSPAKLREYRKAIWQPRRWDWIDPKNDATAKITEVRGGLTSILQIMRERGRDPETVFGEIAESYEMAVAAGIPQRFIDVMFGILPAPEAAPSKADESVAKEPK